MDNALEMHKIFEKYYELSSIEWRKTIVGYEPLDKSVELPSGADRKTAIKISFKNKDWIRVYRIGNKVEWY
ncbi:hypothetical protein [Clostridium beijerinckii]|uniref:Uncharacterized protein n=1 Tax=Clostridium beijerinckii TaxID=1520 RepID=A0AAE5LRN6_CLOBE|nr:hypothetical protein [Clostridium beijerinckii]NRT34015.1 hypothetical protein [Clostridium beijerinckii]NRT46555.1 hypothetical protein [Clostridium beijerinckii]NRZ19440.1 hypothetical protein [Clostridium beijerinckii]NSB15938.1 hypothetical protein [Clostridium beijerinckii]OOM33267.1 hypothetical protein CLOBE_06050 [Clostridium beijerinckii]